MGFKEVNNNVEDLSPYTSKLVIINDLHHCTGCLSDLFLTMVESGSIAFVCMLGSSNASVYTV